MRKRVGIPQSIYQSWKFQVSLIDQFRYIKIQSETIDLRTRLWRINTEFMGFIPQSPVLRSIVPEG